MSLLRKMIAPVLTFGLLVPLIASCDKLPGVPGLPGDCSSALESGDFSSIKFEGDASVQGKVKGFLEASVNFKKTATEVEGELIAACAEMGKAMGVDAKELEGKPGDGEGAKKVCGAVQAKIDVIIKANAEAKLSAEIGEPTCTVDIEALNNCFAECGAKIEPAEFEASCEGGKISGKCEAECSGKCTLDAGAKCSGTCSGTCSGKCAGDCKGKCDGKDGSAKCAGKCEGSCSAKCDGTCSASCEVDVKGKCEGECSGGCTAEVKAPKCSGSFKPPKVDFSCQTNCSAKVKAECRPPTIRITVSGKANADIEKLVAGLEIGLPKIVGLGKGASVRLVQQGEGLVKAGADLGSVGTSVGLQGAACIAGALDIAKEASASVSVNVEVSAKVSGSASSG